MILIIYKYSSVHFPKQGHSTIESPHNPSSQEINMNTLLLSIQTPFTLVNCSINIRTFVIFQYSQSLLAFQVLNSFSRIFCRLTMNLDPSGISSRLCFLHMETTNTRLCSSRVSPQGDVPAVMLTPHLVTLFIRFFYCKVTILPFVTDE